MSFGKIPVTTKGVVAGCAIMADDSVIVGGFDVGRKYRLRESISTVGDDVAP